MPGPKSKEERELMFRKFIKLRAQGKKRSQIVREVGIHDNTFTEWARIDDEEEVFLTVERPGGRLRKTSEREDQDVRSLALERNWDNIDQLRESDTFHESESLSAVSNATIRRRLSDQGLRRRVAAVKDRLRECHKVRRLTYANQMINWDLVDWSRAIFIDEFRLSSGDSGQLFVWREKGTRYEERNIALVNHTYRLNVSFIAFFSFHGLGPLCIIETLNKETYANFLQEYLMPYIAQHFDDGNVMLLHDNHTAHTSNFVKDWINENIGAVEDFVVPHPSLSSDLNPTENVGSMIKGMVRSQRPVINSQEELLTALRGAHQQMCDVSWRQYFINLIDSMPRRLQAVRDASGGYTRY